MKIVMLRLLLILFIHVIDTERDIVRKKQKVIFGTASTLKIWKRNINLFIFSKYTAKRWKHYPS
jgi:hypothetical protein